MTTKHGRPSKSFPSTPRALADVERAASDHERAGRVEHARGDAAIDLVGRGIRCTLGAVAGIEHRAFATLVVAGRAAHPLVHALTVDAERMLDAHARCGGEAVERHRHLEEDVRHGHAFAGTCRSSGPLYTESGRMSALEACCSMMCAVQPVTRLATKSGVNVSVSNPIRW